LAEKNMLHIQIHPIGILGSKHAGAPGKLAVYRGANLSMLWKFELFLLHITVDVFLYYTL
jgi:hypothetical protein